ncbi:MAG: stage II sporulation protein M [Chthonomonadaceae bacterium]|nr:stage II sporulation protein M [Chthonomonadaceae bacterium]
MNEELLLRKRVDDWRRLEVLTAKADNGLKRLSGEETVELIRLYRKSSSDLALLATQTSNFEVVDHLNDIVTRAYGVIYRKERRPLGAAILTGVRDAARAFRKHWAATALSTAIFLAGTATSFLSIRGNQELRERFVSADMEENFAHWKSGTHEARQGGESVGMTAFYAVNNPRVGILSTAASVTTLGTLTAYLLFTNGSLLGALAADMVSVGKLPFLLTSIAPHGVSEVGGILVTASAGFVLAGALIRPGKWTRFESLRLAGKDAFLLLVTGLTMIVIAAPIEGFLSFNPVIPSGFKVTFALASLGTWAAFFIGFGREEPVLPLTE